MKKLLLSSAVMFFLCSISFAQQQKQISAPKQKISALLTPAQKTELEQKKIREYEALQKGITPEKQLEMDAKKMQAQINEKEKKLALKNAQKAETIFNAPLNK